MKLTAVRAMAVGTIGQKCGFSEQIDANAKMENLKFKALFMPPRQADLRINVDQIMGSITATITATITGNGTAVTGLGGAAGYGETALERADANAVRLDVSAVFETGFAIGGGIAASDLYISTDGLIAFGAPLSGLPADPGALSLPFIAPFLADVDTRLDGEGAESGAVWIDIDTSRDVVSITWADVGFYRRNASLTNTFQLQLFDRGEGNFDAVLRYQSLEWTSGDLEGGWGGTGGTAAFIGYDLGTVAAPVTLAASGQEAAQLALPQTIGNTGVAGLWVFAFGPGNQPPPNDDPTTFTATAAAETLTGGAGFDTVSYAGPTAVTVDLASPARNTGLAAGDQFTSIEALIGGDNGDVLAGSGAANQLDGGGGHDSLTGRDGADTLIGGAGNDTLAGGAGADMLTGGDGFDNASYSDATTAVQADLEGGAGTGDATGDRFSGIEGLIGSAQNDGLAGDAGANSLDGGAGDDTLTGRGGADRLIGGAGLDYASYANALTGVVVDMATPAANTGDATGDTCSGIEGLIGSAQADDLRGDTAADILDGGAGNDSLSGRDGNDTLIGQSGGDWLTGDAGDDLLTGGDGNDTLTGGAGNDTLDGGAGTDSLTGGAGTDWVSFVSATLAVTVDLITPGLNKGAALGDKLAEIEGIIGSNLADDLRGSALADLLDGGAGHDTLQGRAGADQLFGGAGNDVLDGGLGADRLDGGDGFDTVSYATASAALRLDLMSPLQNLGAALGDTVISIESVIGSGLADTLSGSDLADRLDGGAGHDLLTGRGGNDVLTGGAGNDTLTGGAGADSLTGGDGLDLASYSAAQTSVVVDLGAATLNTGEAAGDILTGIEVICGSAFADVLAGDIAANRLEGGMGADLLYGRAGADKLFGGAGNDTLDGGWGNDALTGNEGFDFASYASAASGLRVDLITPKLNTAEALGDVFNAIEGLIGSAFADDLRGTSQSNILSGGAGHDLLSGRGGHDTIFGDSGNDTLDGGYGGDVLDGGDGYDWAIYASATAGQLLDLATPSRNIYSAQGDVFISIEAVRGSNFRDTIWGDAQANHFDGSAGNDTLGGRDGADTLWGGLGDDNLMGGDGADWLQGGAGRDRLMGESGTDRLEGGDGNDTLSGGTGENRLTGGLGADRFESLGTGMDVITDYAAKLGDVLAFTVPGATRAQFRLSFAAVDGEGTATAEAFVTHLPSGQVLWTITDGAAMTDLNLRLGSVTYDLI